MHHGTYACKKAGETNEWSMKEMMALGGSWGDGCSKAYVAWYMCMRVDWGDNSLNRHLRRWLY